MLKAQSSYPGTPIYGKIQSLSLSETDKAYIAGFIDGEGSISIKRWKSKPSHQESWGTHIQITSVERNILEYISKKAGQGKIIKIKLSNYRGRENQRDYYKIAISSRRAVILLKAILPYLKIKQRQAEIAIEFQKLIGYDWPKKGVPKGTTYIPKENLERRWALWKECRMLNSRGVEGNTEGGE